MKSHLLLPFVCLALHCLHAGAFPKPLVEYPLTGSPVAKTPATGFPHPDALLVPHASFLEDEEMGSQVLSCGSALAGKVLIRDIRLGPSFAISFFFAPDAPSEQQRYGVQQFLFSQGGPLGSLISTELHDWGLVGYVQSQPPRTNDDGDDNADDNTGDQQQQASGHFFSHPSQADRAELAARCPGAAVFGGGEWHYLTVTTAPVSETEMSIQLYLDGHLRGETSGIRLDDFQVEGPLYLCGSATRNTLKHFRGRVAHLAIHDVSLSTQDSAELFHHAKQSTGAGDQLQTVTPCLLPTRRFLAESSGNTTTGGSLPIGGNGTAAPATPPAVIDGPGNDTTVNDGNGTAVGVPPVSPPAGNGTNNGTVDSPPSAPVGNGTTPTVPPPAGNSTAPPPPVIPDQGNGTTNGTAPPPPASNVTTPLPPAPAATPPPSNVTAPPPAGSRPSPSPPAPKTPPLPPADSAAAGLSSGLVMGIMVAVAATLVHLLN
eukprot:jgi/Mesvir1/7159/Mv02519-RA.1